MHAKSLIFCVAALAIAFLCARYGFSAAALPLADIQAAKSPQSAELFDDVDIEDFGAIPVLDMVEYYIESPPIVADDSPDTQKKVRFQGC